MVDEDVMIVNDRMSAAVLVMHQAGVRFAFGVDPATGWERSIGQCRGSRRAPFRFVAAQPGTRVRGECGECGTRCAITDDGAVIPHTLPMRQR